MKIINTGASRGSELEIRPLSRPPKD